MASQDMPNVSTRSHKKNSQDKGKDKEYAPESSATAAGDKSNKSIPQSGYLTGFSAEQAESLSKFMNDAIQTAMGPLQSRLEHTLLTALAKNSANPTQNPAQPNPPHSTGANPLNPDPFGPPQESNLGGTPPQFGYATRSPWARWRPEDLGTFNPDDDDVYTFVGRIREVANLRDSHTVALNLSLQLRGKAKKWFELELTLDDRNFLYEPANGVQAWTDALINRFRPSGTLLLQKLHDCTYTRADAAAKKDPIDYVHDIIALTRTRPIDESLYEAYLRFESGLRVNLVPPIKYTSVPEFIDQIEAKKGAWYQNYAHFRKRDDSESPKTMTNTYGPNAGRPNNRQYNIRPGLDRNTPGNSPGNGPGNTAFSRPPQPTYGTSTPRAPQVYHGTPEHRPSQSHTPRSFGNTHDNDDEEEVYHMDETHEHGCNVIGCPHRHND